MTLTDRAQTPRQTTSVVPVCAAAGFTTLLGLMAIIAGFTTLFVAMLPGRIPAPPLPLPSRERVGVRVGGGAQVSPSP